MEIDEQIKGDTSPRGYFPSGIHEPHGIATGGIIPRGEVQLLAYMKLAGVKLLQG